MLVCSGDEWSAHSESAAVAASTAGKWLSRVLSSTARDGIALLLANDDEAQKPLDCVALGSAVHSANALQSDALSVCAR